jgi:hypothetical protein
MKRLLLIEGTVTEVKSEGYVEREARIAELEKLLRESLNVTGDGEWHRKVHTALGEEPPSLKKLTTKI